MPLLLLSFRGGGESGDLPLSRWLVPAMAMVVVMIGMGATWQAMVARQLLVLIGTRIAGLASRRLSV